MQDSDLELLELAALAADIEFAVIHDTPRRKCDAGWTPWNPLEDDGDAMRLFTRLPFRELYVSEIGATVSWKRGDGSGHGFKCDEYANEHNGDINAAARRAIVRAAADIGRRMK
jgi:hypothetical protein